MARDHSMLEEVQLLYSHLFTDLGNMHPSIRTDLQRDLSRLRKAAISSGLPFFTITLPDSCKWFDYRLQLGLLTYGDRPPHFGAKSHTDERPRFLHGLFDGVFEPDGMLRLAPDISCIQSIRQILLLCKKLNMECEKRYTDESVAQFHEIERSLPGNRSETWDSDIPSWTHLTGHPIWGPAAEFNGQTCLFDTPDPLLQLDDEYNWEGLRRFSARVLSSFGQFDPFATKPKHGPGAVSDRERGFVKNDHKFWSERLESVFPYDWHANTSLSVPDYVTYEEHPSVMHAVPKTQKGPRLIAAEPIAHQWIQQGIRRWLEERCGTSFLSPCIDFRSQEKSKEMALQASLGGELATVDLSSASDRLSTRLVQYLFQVNRPLLDGLHASRTRALTSLNGETVLLRKFATQGSAVIFPVQSIVYTILAIWSVGIADECTSWKHLSKIRNQVRVFGDDIILPSHAYPVLRGLLETLLLKVNDTKTFSTGKFRESCGMDAYDGLDVTPAYFRSAYSRSPESLASVVECSNNFHKKGYWHTAEYLAKTVPESELARIPVALGLGAVGLYSFCGRKLDHLRSRFNDRLHRMESQIIDVTAKVPAIQGHGEGSLTQFFFEEPDPLLPYKSGEPAKPQLRKKLRWVASER